MKKRNVNPLDLDKETIAKLDEKQLEAIAGGASDDDSVLETVACNIWTGCCLPSCCGTTANHP